MNGDKTPARRRYFGDLSKKHVEERKRKKAKAREKKWGPPAEEMRIDKIVNRQGPITAPEFSIIEQIAKGMDHEMTPDEEVMIGKLMKRTPEAIHKLILDAREKFIENAMGYVDKHKLAVEKALEKGDFDVAARHSEWAMERMAHEGVTMLEAVQIDKKDGGPKIVVGINMGGMQDDR